jgi:methylglutaconyl-CoA hydratase
MLRADQEKFPPARPVRMRCAQTRPGTGADGQPFADEVNMNYKTLVVESRNDIGIVWMSRSDRGNALDETMVAELTAAMRALDDDSAVRAVVLCGVGDAFCTGADRDWLQRMTDNGFKRNHADAMKLATLLDTVHTLKKPTVARVHGPVLNDGAGLVAACDMAVASYDAEFCLSEVRAGLIPTAMPYLIRTMGERAARHYCLSAKCFTAAEAYRIGLVTDIAPLDELDARINELLGQLLQGAPSAQASVKDWIRAAAGGPITPSLLDDGAKRHAAACSSEEAREGLGALLVKRKPAWLRKTRKPAPAKKTAARGKRSP